MNKIIISALLIAFSGVAAAADKAPTQVHSKVVSTVTHTASTYTINCKSSSSCVIVCTMPRIIDGKNDPKIYRKSSLRKIEEFYYAGGSRRLTLHTSNDKEFLLLSEDTFCEID